MKLLLRLSREAVRYKKLYVIAILSTLCLTGVNLTAPKVLSAMTGIVEKGVTEEGMKTTPNHLIHIGSPIPFDADSFLKQLQKLMDAAYDGQDEEIHDLVAALVPTYFPAGEHGSEKKGKVFDAQMRIIERTAALIK